MNWTRAQIRFIVAALSLEYCSSDFYRRQKHESAMAMTDAEWNRAAQEVTRFRRILRSMNRSQKEIALLNAIEHWENLGDSL